ncbi:MAG: hypothetical protein Q7W45_14670 [Bacteroidota bacterium]|nr:hypothetical protein [Bacteroidota bacterium]MDP3147389.1 hypothetical protein [Bacteroidota bacterium]
MIRAEKAQRIMQLYESDYDNFLDKLKAKRKAKKAAAQQKKSEADKADKTVSEAEGYKKKHLGQKAKDLLDKAGGIEGAQSTIQNVMKYFKSSEPSDYEMNVGGSGEGDPKAEKTIMGLPPIAVYAGGALLVLAGLYGLSRMMKNKNVQAQQQIQTPAPAPVVAEPVLQAAA